MSLITNLLIWHFLLLSFNVSEQAIEGQWYTGDREAIIHIYKNEDAYNGRIVWIRQPKDEKGELKRDIKNPDISQRTRLITEVLLLQNFQFDGESTWRNGLIYNPEDGKEYSGQITLKDNNTLILRGYIGSPILGRSVTWSRK